MKYSCLRSGLKQLGLAGTEDITIDTDINFMDPSVLGGLRGGPNALIAQSGMLEGTDIEPVRKRVFLRHLILKLIILPRQARDKHTETIKKR